MPYLNGYSVYSHWGDVFAIPVLLTISAGGALASYKAPPTVTIAKTGTGAYTVTLGDGPYYQCVGVLTSFDQSGSLDTNAEVMGRPVTDGSGTTCVLTTLASSAAANWTNAGTVSAVVLVRKSPVP